MAQGFPFWNIWTFQCFCQLIQIQLKRNLLRQNATAISFRGKTYFLHFSAAALWHSLWWVYSLLFRIKLWNLNLFTYESFMAVCSERPGPWLQMRHQNCLQPPSLPVSSGDLSQNSPSFHINGVFQLNQQTLDKASSAEAIGSSNIGVISQTLA